MNGKKDIIIGIFVIILMLVIIPLVSADVIIIDKNYLASLKEKCGLSMNLDIVTYEKEVGSDNLILSHEQPNEYAKELDILYINSSFITVNEANCEINITYLNVRLTDPKGKVIDGYITFSESNMVFSEGFLIGENDWIKGFGIGKEIFTYLINNSLPQNALAAKQTQKLYIPGVWKIEIFDSEGKKIQNAITSQGLPLPVPEHFLVKDLVSVKNLQVAEKSIETSRSAVKWTAGIGIVTILIMILTFCLERKYIRNERKRIQDDLLESLNTTLKIISNEAEGQIKEFNKKVKNKRKPNIPSYFITKLDAGYYITRISSKINSIDTKLLKETIVKVTHKIETINNLVRLAQLSDTLGKKEKTKEIVREIKKHKYTYHADLQNILTKLNEMIDKIKD